LIAICLRLSACAFICAILQASERFAGSSGVAWTARREPAFAHLLNVIFFHAV
jgi:hypothetical protein